MTSVAALTITGCLAVSAGADRIMLRDLAPAFSALPEEVGETPVAFAPAPGVRRLFGLAELRRVAARFHIAGAPEREICFERPVAPLTPARLLEPMQRALPEAHIEILDFSHFPAPEGDLEFPAAGLYQTAGGEVWNGRVRYAGGRRFAVWAKVRVRIRSSQVVAISDLPAGHVVTADQLRLESGEIFPTGASPLDSIGEVAGRVLRHSVRAGTPLQPQWLDAATDVARGDTVRVEVNGGRTRLEMQAVAETGGSVGQSILMRNPESKKRFRARIVGKGKVSIGL